MERYAAYKDSGVEWIGKIPEGWEVKKLKYDVLVNPPKEGIDKESSDMVVFLPMEKVKEDGKIDCSIKKPISELYSGFTFFRKNDVIIAKITPCFENGKGALLNELETDIGFGSTEFHVLRAKQNICNRFLYYITKSEIFMKTGEAFMSGAAGQKRVPTDFISDFPLASPSVEEQTAIANYLDRKTAEIDALIAQKQRLIELYQEEKTAIINQAVTQGITPNAKLKDSGIDWLGEIPERWEVAELRRFIRFITSGSRGWAEHYADAGKIFVRIGNLTRNSIDVDLSDIQYVDPPVGTEGERTRIFEGDVLFSITAYIGSVAVATDAIAGAYINQHIALVRPLIDKIFPRYVAYVALSDLGQSQLSGKGYGGTKIQLALDDVKSLLIPAPPLSEQTAIVHHIETETARIDAKIAKTQRIIELQKEYRSALISEAVTGKIKVPDTAAQESGL